jgi:hypothetical protein
MKSFVFKERKSTGIASTRYRLMQRKKENLDEDDEDDEDENEKIDLDKADENVSNLRERRFRDFASVEYRDEIFMVN